MSAESYINLISHHRISPRSIFVIQPKNYLNGRGFIEYSLNDAVGLVKKIDVFVQSKPYERLNVTQTNKTICEFNQDELMVPYLDFSDQQQSENMWKRTIDVDVMISKLGFYFFCPCHFFKKWIMERAYSACIILIITLI